MRHGTRVGNSLKFLTIRNAKHPLLSVDDPLPLNCYICRRLLAIRQFHVGDLGACCLKAQSLQGTIVDLRRQRCARHSLLIVEPFPPMGSAIPPTLCGEREAPHPVANAIGALWKWNNLRMLWVVLHCAHSPFTLSRPRRRKRRGHRASLVWP